MVVCVNGNRVCTAGVREDGMLTTQVRWAGVGGGERVFHMLIACIDHSTHEKFSWDTPPLSVGDEVVIKVIETDEIDPPSRQHH